MEHYEKIKRKKLILKSENGKNIPALIEDTPYIILNDPVHNSFIDYCNFKEVKDVYGATVYKFRKGVGNDKGGTHRVFFVEKYKDSIGKFYAYKKVGNRLKVDESKNYYLEYKYLHPFIRAPHLTYNGLNWAKEYIIFPYKNKSKKVISKEVFKQEAPLTYSYLEARKNILSQQSKYNKRIQNSTEYYSLIRIGTYTYGRYFVAIRDNTRLVANVIGWIETDWGEKKLPIFDGHISYISQKPDNNNFISKKEAEYIAEKINDPRARKLVENIFDSRSFSSRLPIKIEEFAG